jgi:hypothetical protein
MAHLRGWGKKSLGWNSPAEDPQRVAVNVEIEKEQKPQKELNPIQVVP